MEAEDQRQRCGDGEPVALAGDVEGNEAGGGADDGRGAGRLERDEPEVTVDSLEVVGFLGGEASQRPRVAIGAQRDIETLGEQEAGIPDPLPSGLGTAGERPRRGKPTRRGLPGAVEAVRLGELRAHGRELGRVVAANRDEVGERRQRAHSAPAEPSAAANAPASSVARLGSASRPRGTSRRRAPTDAASSAWEVKLVRSGSGATQPATRGERSRTSSVSRSPRICAEGTAESVHAAATIAPRRTRGSPAAGGATATRPSAVSRCSQPEPRATSPIGPRRRSSGEPRWMAVAPPSLAEASSVVGEQRQPGPAEEEGDGRLARARRAHDRDARIAADHGARVQHGLARESEHERQHAPAEQDRQHPLPAGHGTCVDRAGREVDVEERRPEEADPQPVTVEGRVVAGAGDLEAGDRAHRQAARPGQGRRAVGGR